MICMLYTVSPGHSWPLPLPVWGASGGVEGGPVSRVVSSAVRFERSRVRCLAPLSSTCRTMIDVGGIALYPGVCAPGFGFRDCGYSTYDPGSWLCKQQHVK